MRDIPHELTEDNFVSLSHRLVNFSGSDINILVRDAVYEPVRRLQMATMFKKLGNGKYMPCRKGEQGEKMSWLDFKDQSQLDIGSIQMDDFEAALIRTKPSVNK